MTDAQWRHQHEIARRAYTALLDGPINPALTSGRILAMNAPGDPPAHHRRRDTSSGHGYSR